MTLYEIDKAIENCMRISDSEVVDTSTGEVLDTEYLEQLEMDREKKIENCIKFYKNSLADSKIYKEEAQRLSKLAKTSENRAEQMKKYLSTCLNGEKFKSNDGLHQANFRKSESVEIVDLFSIPDDFLKYKEPEPNKTEIKKAIKEGRNVAGAVLVEKNNISIK